MDALQVPLVCFPAFEYHFCGHEQECARIYRGTLSADNSLKFSEEAGFRGLHARILELPVRRPQDNGRVLPLERAQSMSDISWLQHLRRVVRSRHSRSSVD